MNIARHTSPVFQCYHHLADLAMKVNYDRKL